MNIQVIEPGHIYGLPHIGGQGQQFLVFLKRTPDGDGDHPGTNTQSVIRAIIDRTEYMDTEVPAIENRDYAYHAEQMLYHSRMMILCYEGRAYRRKMDKLNRTQGEHHSFRERDKDLPFDHMGYIGGEQVGIENLPLGPDGHILIPT